MDYGRRSRRFQKNFRDSNRGPEVEPAGPLPQTCESQVSLGKKLRSVSNCAASSRFWAWRL